MTENDGGGSGKLDRRGFFTQGLQRALRDAVGAFGERFSPVAYVRPPGALPEAAFVGACTRCGACLDACPVHAITMLPAHTGLASGTPTLNLNGQACIMCETMPCAAACPTPALDVPAWGWRDVKLATIAIAPSRCITYQGVECGICVRVCPVGEDAIKLDDRGHPVIGAACTGCGQCIGACVTTPSSITYTPLEMMS